MCLGFRDLGVPNESGLTHPKATQPPTYNSQGIRLYMILGTSKEYMHDCRCFFSAGSSQLLLKLSVKAALWRSLAPCQGAGTGQRPQRPAASPGVPYQHWVKNC